MSVYALMHKCLLCNQGLTSALMQGGVPGKAGSAGSPRSQSSPVSSHPRFLCDCAATADTSHKRSAASAAAIYPGELHMSQA